ncbi:MAG: hypothetical protein MUF45_17730 [Spirosomaceae bacterium]|nr:hypothetical protein [Spirosomataceae bacterium]
MINLNRREAIQVLLLVFVVAYCLISFIYFFYGYATNNPYLDDYWAVFDTIYLTDQSFGDSHRFPYVLHPNLEHIIFYTKSISWVLHKILDKSFSLVYLMLLGDLAWFGSIFFIIYKFYSTLKPNLGWLGVILLLGFSMQLHENFFWGMASTQNLTIIFFALLTFHFIIKKPPFYFWASLTFAVLSFLTSSPGLLVFAVGLIYLIVKRRFRRLAIWSLCFGISSYFYIALTPSTAETKLHNLANILYFSGGILHFEGQLWPALIFGGLVIAFYAYYIFTSNLQKLTKLEQFILSIVAFVGLVIVLGSLKREDVLLSRYKVYSVLIVICGIILAYIRWENQLKKKNSAWIILLVLGFIYNIYSITVYQYDIKKIAHYKWADAYNYYANNQFNTHFNAHCNNDFYIHKIQHSKTNLYKHPNIQSLLSGFESINQQKPIKQTRIEYRYEKTPAACLQKIMKTSIKHDNPPADFYYLMLAGSKNHLYSVFRDRNDPNFLYTEINLQYLKPENYKIYLVSEKDGIFVKRIVDTKIDFTIDSSL